MNPETSEIASFVAVSDLGSVSAAAKELGLPRATVSRRLARLEDRLGVRLIHRTTRRLHLTDAGDEFYQHARSILDAVELATLAIQQNDAVPSGLLRVSVPPMSGPDLAEMLVDFAEGHPRIDLEVTATTAHQDLIANNIDVALRAGSDIDPGLIARLLSRSEVLCVASQAYLEQHGTPMQPSELVDHACLVGFTRGERPATHWPLRDGGKVRVRGKLVSNNLELLKVAAVRGRGIALLPRLFVVEDLAQGVLTAVLPETVGGATQVSLVYPERRLLKPSVRAFVDHVVAWVQGGGMQPD